MPHRSSAQYRPRPRLLVVDDEAPQQRALCEILVDQGYDVVGCTDPLVALGKLDHATFELLLTDLQMPGMDGIELTRRAQALAPDMVIVLMTAHGSIGSVVDAMKNGAIDYVQKPFRISGIVPAVERALEVQRLRVNNRRLEAEVSQQVRELVAVNQELDAFAARLAHDLRGPLVNMRSILAMVLQDADDLHAELLRRGLQSGDLALRMVRDLLTKFSMEEAKPRTIPLSTSLRLSKDEGEPLQIEQGKLEPELVTYLHAGVVDIGLHRISLLSKIWRGAGSGIYARLPRCGKHCVGECEQTLIQ